MLAEPTRGGARNFFERTRFFKKVCSARHNHQFFLAIELLVSLPVQFQNYLIARADYQERRRHDASKCGPGQIGPTSARYDRAYSLAQFGSRDQSRAPSCARTEVADAQVPSISLCGNPISCFDQSSAKEAYVKSQMARNHVKGFFISSQQVKQQRAHTCFAYNSRDILVTRAVATAAASVCE
jgi:hypothetical protein